MRLPPSCATMSISRFICSTPLARWASSSTIHGAKPMALSTVRLWSASFLPRSLSEPPPLTWASSSEIQGSIAWNPAFAAMSTSSEIGSFCPRSVLVLRQYRNGSSFGRSDWAAAGRVESPAATRAPAETRASRRESFPFMRDSPLEGQAAYYFYARRPRKCTLLPGRLLALILLQDFPVRRVLQPLGPGGQVRPERPETRVAQVDLEIVGELRGEDVIGVCFGIAHRGDVLLEAVGLRLLHHLDHVGVGAAQDALALGGQLGDLALDLGHGHFLVAADRRDFGLRIRLDARDHLLGGGGDIEKNIAHAGLQLLELVHDDLRLPLLFLGQLFLRRDLRVLDLLPQLDRDVDVADQAQEHIDIAHLGLVDQAVRERLLELLAGRPLDEVLGAVLRPLDAADGLDLRPDDLPDHVLRGPESVDDQRHILRQQAPDHRDVELNREAVAGGEGDVFQGDLVVADPDLLDFPLVRVPVIDARLQDVLLDAALAGFGQLAFRGGRPGQAGRAPDAPRTDPRRLPLDDFKRKRVQAVLARRQDAPHEALLALLGEEVPGIQLLARHRLHQAHLVGTDHVDLLARVHVVLKRAEEVAAFAVDVRLDPLHALLHDAVAVRMQVLLAQLVGEDQDLAGLHIDATDRPAPEADVEEEEGRDEPDHHFYLHVHGRPPTSSGFRRSSSSRARAG